MTSRQLEDFWAEGASGVKKAVADEWFKKIREQYEQPERSYHNIDYLQEKLEHFESIKEHVKNPQALILALFFHQFKYDPRAVDCDEQNVETFRQYATQSDIDLESDLVNEVTSLLRSAATHSTDAHKITGVYGSEDRHYFLDLDMVAMGIDEDGYTRYAAKVEKEYAFLPAAVYKSLRLKVLINFLQIPNIFATKEFRDKYEKQARKNIQREVDFLKV